MHIIDWKWWLIVLLLSGCCMIPERSSSTDPNTSPQPSEISTHSGTTSSGDSSHSGSQLTPESRPSWDGLNPEYFGKPIIHDDRGMWDTFIIKDTSWKGVYHHNRDFYLISTIAGPQAVDALIGYAQWFLFIELYDKIAKLPVDEASFISYSPATEPLSPGELPLALYHGTGAMTVQDKGNNYEVCRKWWQVDQAIGNRDYERMEELYMQRPIMCFAEDKSYIYAWQRWEGSEDMMEYFFLRMRK